MLDISAIEANIQAQLTQATGIDTWESFQFSLIPEDAALGYIQLLEMPVALNSSTTTLKFMVLISLAAETLDELKTAVYTLVQSTSAAFARPTSCTGTGVLSIPAPGIVIDMFDSYVNENHITNTSYLKARIAFSLHVQTPT